MAELRSNWGGSGWNGAASSTARLRRIVERIIALKLARSAHPLLCHPAAIVNVTTAGGQRMNIGRHIVSTPFTGDRVAQQLWRTSRNGRRTGHSCPVPRLPAFGTENIGVVAARPVVVVRRSFKSSSGRYRRSQRLLRGLLLRDLALHLVERDTLVLHRLRAESLSPPCAGLRCPCPRRPGSPDLGAGESEWSCTTLTPTVPPPCAFGSPNVGFGTVVPPRVTRQRRITTQCSVTRTRQRTCSSPRGTRRCRRGWPCR